MLSFLLAFGFSRILFFEQVKKDIDYLRLNSAAKILENGGKEPTQPDETGGAGGKPSTQDPPKDSDEGFLGLPFSQNIFILLIIIAAIIFIGILLSCVVCCCYCCCPTKAKNDVEKVSDSDSDDSSNSDKNNKASETKILSKRSARNDSSSDSDSDSDSSYSA